MTSRSTTGTDQLRRRNGALLLRTLRREGPATRTELALRTGLAKATVGAIVNDLLAAGAVEEESEDAARVGARGRPGRAVSLSPGAHIGLGLELNVDYVAAVVVDLAGQVLAGETRPAGDAAGVDPVAAVLGLATEMRAAHAGAQLVGAGAAVPALVRGDDRTIAWAPNLPLRGPDLAARLEAALPGVPVGVSNDADCAAYAELHHGAAVGARHALYLTGTVGIGGGIITGGGLLRGGSGFAGEVGHMPIGDPAALCGCGRRGCWEASVGLHAVMAAVGMDELTTPLETAAAVAERAATDPGTRDRLARVGVDVGLGIATLAVVLDPDVVVLGGFFAPLGDLVLGPARDVVAARLVSPDRPGPELRLSTLGIRAAALGAAERSLSTVLGGELGLPAVR